MAPSDAQLTTSLVRPATNVLPGARSATFTRTPSTQSPLRLPRSSRHTTPRSARARKCRPETARSCSCTSALTDVPKVRKWARRRERRASRPVPMRSTSSGLPQGAGRPSRGAVCGSPRSIAEGSRGRAAWGMARLSARRPAGLRHSKMMFTQLLLVQVAPSASSQQSALVEHVSPMRRHSLTGGGTHSVPPLPSPPHTPPQHSLFTMQPSPSTRQARGAQNAETLR
jgi:hypothetical protein